MKTLIVNITVFENQIKNFKEETEFMQHASKKENGCYEYSVYQSVENKCKFTFVETYKDDDAINDHKESVHFKQWKINTSEMIIDKYVTLHKAI